MTILQDMTTTNANAKLMAELEALRAENARLKASKHRALSWKVSEKGAISIYGTGKWPVTLYYSQFQKVRAVWDDICAFVDLAHENGELSEKD